MKKACYGSPGGDLVTPEQFIERATPRYKERGIFPYCQACEERVDLYGVHSPDVTSRFDHQNRDADADPLDDCILAARQDSRFAGLTPEGWNTQKAPSIRKAFFQEENLLNAYAFCWMICGRGNMPFSKFRDMLRRADKKNIWAYADVPLWTIPYILLSLENYTGKSKAGNEYQFHFVFEKPKGTTISSLWLRPGRCKLKKVFSSSGMPMNGRYSPLQVTKENLDDISGSEYVNWARQNPDLLQALRRFV